jgi:hypothetical protein
VEGFARVTVVYRIRDWERHFEKAKSKTIERCAYVCLPNKQDGVGFARIMAEVDGMALFGVWTAIVQACSRQGKGRSGWLTDNGNPPRGFSGIVGRPQNNYHFGIPWTAEELAFRWRRPVVEIDRALSLIADIKIGWLERLHLQSARSDTAGAQRDTAGAQPDTVSARGILEGREGTEGKEGRDASTPGLFDGGPSQAPTKTESPIPTLVFYGAIIKGDDTADNWAEMARLASVDVVVAALKTLQVAGRPGYFRHVRDVVQGIERAIVRPEPLATDPADALIATHGWTKVLKATGIPGKGIRDELDLRDALRDESVLRRAAQALGGAA